MSGSPGKRKPLSSKKAADSPVVTDSVQKLVADFWEHWENLDRDYPRA